jgi:hypothetical protein
MAFKSKLVKSLIATTAFLTFTTSAYASEVNVSKNIPKDIQLMGNLLYGRFVLEKDFLLDIILGWKLGEVGARTYEIGKSFFWEGDLSLEKRISRRLNNYDLMKYIEYRADWDYGNRDRWANMRELLKGFMNDLLEEEKSRVEEIPLNQ